MTGGLYLSIGSRSVHLSVTSCSCSDLRLAHTLSHIVACRGTRKKYTTGFRLVLLTPLGDNHGANGECFFFLNFQCPTRLSAKTDAGLVDRANSLPKNHVEITWSLLYFDFLKISGVSVEAKQSVVHGALFFSRLSLGRCGTKDSEFL